MEQNLIISVLRDTVIAYRPGLLIVVVTHS